MSFVFLGTSLRSSVTILMASKRISMMLLMRASRGASGNAATNMVVKLNWITENTATATIRLKTTFRCASCVIAALCVARTHFQELIEQAEGVHVVETVVAQPVSELAVVAQLGSVFGLLLVFQVTVGAFPLQLLGPSPPQPPVEPAGETRHTRVTCAPINTNRSDRLHSRAGELEDVADGLFEHHDDGHLDEEVCETSAGVTLGRDRVHR